MKLPKRDVVSELARLRAEILAEYKFYDMKPIRIGGEPISIELAVQLGLIIDTTQEAT
jgi:hypothetical protein